MAKVYSGTYGKDTTDETALVTNLLKYPEIGKKLIQQYPRYSLTYLLEAAGRNAAEKIIGDYAFEWKMMGRYRKPAVADGSDQSLSASAGATFTFIIDHEPSAGIYGDNLNVNDVIRFSDGSTALVTNVPTVTSSDSTNTITARAIDAISITLVAGDIVGCIGNAFNQGSLASEVGQNYMYPDTYKNWLTLSRKKTKIMGSDLTDVTWIESNGHRLWYFTKEQQMTDQFMYELELQRWYGKKSSTQTAPGYPGDTGLDTGEFVSGVPIMGDGLLAQIDGANQATYTAGALTEEDIVNFMGTLNKNAINPEGNVYTVFTGTQGRIDFHRAMKDLLVTLGSGTPVFAGKQGITVELGANFSEYNILGNKMILAYCPVFDDDNLHSATSSTFDSSNESGKMVFVDMSMQQGVSNVELIAKGAEGFNRSFVKKYVPGMVNPYDYNSMMAANGDDFFECQILSESGIILRNPLSCGILSNS
tara:strand:+ start:1684 stop:3111 length:1428 start_codon:yes stop_codon:yes gene_type:complete